MMRLAICAYIDLNPVAAGIAVVPEASPHTSVTTRVEHVNAQGRAKYTQGALRDIPHPGCASRPWALMCDAFSVRRDDATFVTADSELRVALSRPRLKIGTSWIRVVKGCWKGFRWEAT